MLRWLIVKSVRLYVNPLIITPSNRVKISFSKQIAPRTALNPKTAWRRELRWNNHRIQMHPITGGKLYILCCEVHPLHSTFGTMDSPSPSIRCIIYGAIFCWIFLRKRTVGSINDGRKGWWYRLRENLQFTRRSTAVCLYDVQLQWFARMCTGGLNKPLGQWYPNCGVLCVQLRTAAKIIMQLFRNNECTKNGGKVDC